MYDARESEGNAEILFYNVGHGDGYAVCLHCGRTAFTEEQLAGHKRLRGGKNNDNERNAVCSGNDASLAIRSNVILGGRFRTDFCEIRFKDENNVFSRNESLLYSLGAVISKELAHYLAVDEREIDFGIKRYDRFSSVFIFDTAKGGAGYAPQFTLYADEIFKFAKEKLSRCDCDKACIRCLIDRKSQWHIDKLDRELAVRWLELVTNLQVPTVFLEDYPNLKTVAASVKDEIGRMSYANKIRVIWLFGSTDVASWEMEKLQFLNKLRNKVKVHYVLSNGNSAMTTQDKITLIQLKEWAEIWQLQSPRQRALKTVCKIETDEGKVVEYLSEDFEQTFNENWGSATKGLLYKNSEGSLSEVKMFDISIDEQSVFVKSIEPNNSIQSNEIADLLLEKLNGSLDLKSLLQGQSFNIEYCDRYLKSPLSCILLVQFMDRLKNKLGFDIASFKFKGQSFLEPRPLRLLQHNFANASDRNNALLSFAQDLKIPNPQTVNEDLPHYRYFEFNNENLKITVRPDAGIAYGWFFDGNAYKKPFNNRTNASDVFTIKNEKQELLFTVSIEKTR